MSSPDIVIARGDTLPAVVADLSWPNDGVLPADLSPFQGVSPVVTFSFHDSKERTVVCSIVDATLRRVSWLPVDGDTNESGLFKAYFYVKFPWLNRGIRCPNDRALIFQVSEDV